VTPTHPEVTVEKMVPGAYGLARLDGRILLLRGAIPGERVRVRLDRRGKGGVQFGEVVDVLSASPDRVTPTSDPRCGGLALAHVAEARQLALKQDILADALHRIARLGAVPPIAAVASPFEGWRLRARLHVHRGRLGFYREGTHEVCTPPASQLPDSLRQAAESTLASMDEAWRTEVAEVVVAEDVAGTRRAVHLVLRRPLGRVAWPDGVVPGDVAGVSVGWRGEGGPTTVAGDAALTATLVSLGAPVGDAAGALSWHPAAFFQANRFIVPALVARVLDAVGGRPAVDLFAGVGLFGVCAAAAGSPSVLCVEGDALAATWLRRNADALQATGNEAVTVREGAVEDVLADVSDDLDRRVVIVDPPRTGLPPDACARLAAARPPTLVYVSCDPPTLARDLRRFLEAGYRLRSVELFDMFPQTAHLETLAILDPPSAA